MPYMPSRFTVCLWALAASVAFAQSPAFEAASVRPTPADSRIRPAIRGGPGTSDPGQITFTNIPLLTILQRAYDAKSYQISGPAWLSQSRYDVIAKLPPNTAKEQAGAMLQNLLAERFHLALHHETRDLQGYELVAARNGPKLKPSPAGAPTGSVEPEAPPKRDVDGFPILDAPGLVVMEGVRGKSVVVFMTAKVQPVSALVDRIARDFRQPVVDKTGLSGYFDFNLEFAPRPPDPLAQDASDDAAPNLITAVQQQLGLRLNPVKVPIDMLIIDRADPVPSGN